MFLNNNNNPLQSEISFKFKSFHHQIFEKSLNKIFKKIKTLNLNDVSIVSLPIRIKRFTVLRSPHIDKKSREQFEIKHYNKLLVVCYNPTDSSDVLKINFLINYIKNSCSGCQLKIKYTIK
jgi:small subunit ribosomal protein S10